jgi:hypothetical protein
MCRVILEQVSGQGYLVLGTSPLLKFSVPPPPQQLEETQSQVPRYPQRPPALATVAITTGMKDVIC